MSPEEFRKLVQASRRTLRQLEVLLGRDHSIISRYCSGELPVPDEVARRANEVLRPIVKENLRVLAEAL